MLTHLFLLLAMAAGQAVPFTDARWMLLDREARPMPYLGQPSLFIDNGFALLRDSAFGDGTIEFDIAMHGHTSFAGVVFRAASSDDCELVYLRPFLSRQADAVQYTPVFNGFFGWQLYNGKGYTAAAELPLNRWVHVKLVVAGYSAQLFIDRAQEPQLTVTSLKRPWARGMVGLWGNFGGANFANVVVSPADTGAPASRPADSLPTPQPISAWELSPAFETATTKPDVLPARNPNAAREWTAVTAESSGLVNIAQYRHAARTPSSALSSRDLVFARTVVSSPRSQRMKLVFAYSDEVHLFVNGRLLYEGDSAFARRDPSSLGIASLGPDAVYVDLHPGANEIVLAVSEKFGGWGFAARLEAIGSESESDR